MHLDGRRGLADRAPELGRDTEAPPRRGHLEHLVDGVEAVDGLERSLLLEPEEPQLDRREEAGVGRPYVLQRLVLVEGPELDPAAQRVRGGARRMEIEERSACDESPVDSPQGVDDALGRESSQRPGEERDVEAGGRP